MKRIFYIFLLLILFLNLLSCVNKREETILLSSKGNFLILDENLVVLKKINKNLDGKVFISEVKGDLVLFNLQNSDPFKSGIFLLNLKDEKFINVTKDIEGLFLYKPKFYDNENILFSVRDKNANESLYIYSLKNGSFKIISKDIKSSYIYPFYIDNINKKIYIKLLKVNEDKPKISIYDLNKDDFFENYINLNSQIFMTEPNEKGEFILINYDSKTNKETIQIVDLNRKIFKEIYSTIDGHIYDINFFDYSDNILFKYISNSDENNSSIVIIDRDGNLIKEIPSTFEGEFYILNTKLNQIYIMAQEKDDSKYNLYSFNIDNQNIKKLSNNDKYFGGDLIISKAKKMLIISESNYNLINKDYLIMNIDGTRKESIIKKLNIDLIDSIIFLK